jgi:hypothetical protein
VQGIFSPQNSEARTAIFLAVAVGLDGHAFGRKEGKHKRERKEGPRVSLYTTTEKLLRGVSKIASEAGGHLNHLG